MNDKEIKEQEENLANVFFEKLVHSLFKDGTLTISDFDDEKKLLKKLHGINNKTEYQIVIDHTEDLLKTARKFNKTGNTNNAKIFYATYFEHQLNGIINELCIKKSINNKETNNIIRSVNLIGKLTWLPLLLGIPQIAIKHKNVILKLAGDRNAYIHYKHNPEPDEIDENDEQKQQDDIKEIEKTITYFKKYISRTFYKNQKTQLENKLKKRKRD
jgi:hypothetical protein